MYRYLLIITFMLVLVGCEVDPVPAIDPVPQDIECLSNSDCMVGGCSSSVCGTKEEMSNLFTTCEYRPEYGCYQAVECGCFSGECQFEQTPLLAECLKVNS